MGSQTEVDYRRFAEKSIGKLNHPVLIVGQNPGRQRIGQQTGIVWEGNRSADLLKWVIGTKTNIYLTNVCNYREMTPKNVEEGLYDLKVLIDDLQPKKIICLGGYAYLKVKKLGFDIPIQKLPHPSFITRFNKDREFYKKCFQQAI